MTEKGPPELASPWAPVPRPDHPRRCRANRTTRDPATGELRRCKRWAPAGEMYCRKHRRRYHGRRQRGSEAQDPWKLTRELPHVYSTVLSETLGERVRSLAERPLSKQADCSELLALAQVTASDAAQLYDATCLAAEELCRTDPARAMDALRSRLAAGALLREVAADVVDLTAKAVAARAIPPQLVSVDSACLLMSQVVRAAHDVFGEEEPGKVEEFTRRVSEARLMVEGSGRPRGTELTPEAEARAMDASVPPAPPRLSSREEPADGEREEAA